MKAVYNNNNVKITFYVDVEQKKVRILASDKEIAYFSINII